MKFMLLLGLIGHIFCGASDCLLTYAPNGKVNLTDFKDYEKSSVSFRGMYLQSASVSCRHIADEASCQGKCNRRRYVPRTLVFDVRSC